MRTGLLSVAVSMSFLVPTGFIAATPASASVPAGPSPIATGNSYYEYVGGPTDIAVGRDRSVYVTVEANKLFRHHLSYSVTRKEISGGSATLTIGTNLLKPGDLIVVSISDPEFDGTHTVTSATSTTVSFAGTGPDLASAAATGVVVPDPISGATVEITPGTLPSGVSLSGPRAVTVSPDRNSIAVGYTVNAGIAIYPWDASVTATPTRILLGPAGTSTDFAVRNLVWDSQGNIYALMQPKTGLPAQIWVFGPAAAQNDVPSRVILLDAGTSSDATLWSGWAWGHITSDMALGPNDEIAVAGDTGLGWIIAYVTPGITGETKPSGYLHSGVGEVWGVTYDDSGRSIITYLHPGGGLRAWGPGVRSTNADPTPAPDVDVSNAGQGPTRGPIDFDQTNRSIVLAHGGSYGLLYRYATGATATSTTLALPFLGAPGSSTPGSSTPPSFEPSPVSAPEPQTNIVVTVGSTIAQPEQPTGPASPVTSPTASTAPTTIGTSAIVSLPGLVGARLIALGAQGKTCIGEQCVNGRRWTLQMCLPQEANITVQRKISKRWVTQKARQSKLAPLNCPTPARNASIAVPRQTKAANFRIVLRIQDAPRIVSSLKVR